MKKQTSSNAFSFPRLPVPIHRGPEGRDGLHPPPLEEGLVGQPAGHHEDLGPARLHLQGWADRGRPVRDHGVGGGTDLRGAIEEEGILLIEE